jgi:hypothetical protein
MWFSSSFDISVFEIDIVAFHGNAFVRSKLIGLSSVLALVEEWRSFFSCYVGIKSHPCPFLDRSSLAFTRMHATHRAIVYSTTTNASSTSSPLSFLSQAHTSSRKRGRTTFQALDLLFWQRGSMHLPDGLYAMLVCIPHSIS